MTTFTVLGTPKPQGSKRAYINRKTGQPILTESAGAPLRDWRTDVQQAALAAMGDQPPFEGPVGIILDFTLKRPKSHPKTRQTWPTTCPDVDKLVRAVLDAITHVCIVDDGQIVHLNATKSWGTPGVTIAINTENR